MRKCYASFYVYDWTTKLGGTVGKYITSIPNVLRCAEPLIKTPAGSNGKFLGEMVNPKDNF